ARPISFRALAASSKSQLLRLLYLRQRLHLGEHVCRHIAVDLDEGDGVRARRIAADVESRDVDAGVAERRGETADEAGLVEVGDVEHRGAELGVHADALDVDDARPPVGEYGARQPARLL